MLAVNTSAEGLAEDAATMVHVGDVAIAKDIRFQKLILIGLTPALEDVAAEDAVQRMTLALEEERIDSYVLSHWPYVVYLKDDHNTTL